MHLGMQGVNSCLGGKVRSPPAGAGTAHQPWGREAPAAGVPSGLLSPPPGRSSEVGSLLSPRGTVLPLGSSRGLRRRVAAGRMRPCSRLRLSQGDEGERGDGGDAVGKWDWNNKIV